MRARRDWILVGSFVGLAILYLALAFIIPPDAQALSKYHLSVGGAKILSLTILLPYVAIWFVALYGSMKFKSYADKITNTQDGTACAILANGLLLLAYSMPISAVVTNINQYISNRLPEYWPTATIINNYTNLVFALGAFYIIYRGAKRLGLVLKNYVSETTSSDVLSLIFIVTSVAYSYLTLTNPARQHATASVKHAAYYLPDWLLLTTIVIPYVALLFFGLSAVWFMRLYSARVPGVLYKQALRYVVIGIFTALISLIALRMLASMTSWFEKQALKSILSILYLLLIFIGLGYLWIAKGARKLAKIEEVV